MIQNKKSTPFLLLILVAIMLSACQNTPHSKEEYLEKFDAFVELIEDDYKSYSEDVWVQKDKIYKDFSEKWYVKYKEQLEFKEEIIVKKNMIKYQIYRNHKDLKDGLKQGVDALKEVGEDFLEVIESTGDSILNNLDITLDTE